jgi:hypothetical protein
VFVCICTEGISHRPPTVVAGVSGISPNSNLELDREADVATLPWLLWLSPDTVRLSTGGVRGGEGICSCHPGVNGRDGQKFRVNTSIDREGGRASGTEPGNQGSLRIAFCSRIFTAAADRLRFPTLPRETQV